MMTSRESTVSDPTPAEPAPPDSPVDEPTPAIRTLLPLPWAIWFWAQARKIVIAVIGTTVLLAGIAMLVLPGPGWLAIFGGLAILGTEFAWARWMLKYAKQRMGELAKKYVGMGKAKKETVEEKPTSG